MNFNVGDLVGVRTSYDGATWRVESVMTDNPRHFWLVLHDRGRRKGWAPERLERFDYEMVVVQPAGIEPDETEAYFV